MSHIMWVWKETKKSEKLFGRNCNRNAGRIHQEIGGRGMTNSAAELMDRVACLVEKLGVRRL